MIFNFPGGSVVKILPAMQETWVWALGREDPRRRKWQPIPVLLSGKSHWQRSLVGCSPWGLKESDTTEQLHFYFTGNPDSCWCLTGSNFALVWLSLWHPASQEAYKWLQILPNLQENFEQKVSDFTPDGPWHHTGFCREGTLQIPWKGS